MPESSLLQGMEGSDAKKCVESTTNRDHFALLSGSRGRGAPACETKLQVTGEPEQISIPAIRTFNAFSGSRDPFCVHAEDRAWRPCPAWLLGWREHRFTRKLLSIGQYTAQGTESFALRGPLLRWTGTAPRLQFAGFYLWGLLPQLGLRIDLGRLASLLR